MRFQPRAPFIALRACLGILPVLGLGLALLTLSSCVRRGVEGPVERIQTGYSSYQSPVFFSIDYPSDWVTSELPDGANLFYTEDILFVRIKVIDVPDPSKIDQQFGETIQQEARLQGGEPTVVRTGLKDGHPFRWYLITKPTGGRLEEILVYNETLRLLFILRGSSSEVNFDDFSELFAKMFETFQFTVSSEHPPREPELFECKLSTLAGAWSCYMEGLRRRDLDYLTQSLASINAPRLLNDQAVEDVRDTYFPFDAPASSLVVVEEKGEKVASATIAIRALPPEGFLQTIEREFILEDGRWKVLRFE